MHLCTFEEMAHPSGGASIGDDHGCLLHAGYPCVNKAVDWDPHHGSITSSGDSQLDGHIFHEIFLFAQHSGSPDSPKCPNSA